jgi:hypothetical protein
MHEVLMVHVAIAVIDLAIGIYILWENPRRGVNQAFFAFMIGTAGWILGLSLISLTGEFLFVTPTIWGAELMVFALVILAEIFPSGTLERKKAMLVLSPLIVLFFLTPSGLFIKGVDMGAQGHPEPQNGILFPLWALMIALYLAWVAWKFTSHYHRLRGIERV